MYNFYYFEAKADIYGRHFIHKDTCIYLPDSESITVISYDDSETTALATVQRRYKKEVFYHCTFCCNSTKCN